jgi:hypothetical protein
MVKSLHEDFEKRWTRVVFNPDYKINVVHANLPPTLLGLFNAS